MLCTARDRAQSRLVTDGHRKCDTSFVSPTSFIRARHSEYGRTVQRTSPSLVRIVKIMYADREIADMHTIRRGS